MLRVTCVHTYVKNGFLHCTNVHFDDEVDGQPDVVVTTDEQHQEAVHYGEGQFGAVQRPRAESVQQRPRQYEENLQQQQQQQQTFSIYKITVRELPRVVSGWPGSTRSAPSIPTAVRRAATPSLPRRWPGSWPPPHSALYAQNYPPRRK